MQACDTSELCELLRRIPAPLRLLSSISTCSACICACLRTQEAVAAESKAAAEAAAQAAAQAAAIAPAKQLAAALTLRGYKLTLPEVKVGTRKPYVDAVDGSVHWPVLLMYPETGQQDVIEDWHEDDPVEAHLDVVSLVVMVVSETVPSRQGMQGAHCIHGVLKG